MKVVFYIARKGLFSQLPNYAGYDEAIMWRSVIDQALRDTVSENKRVRQEAEKWFDPKNKDFTTVCALAMLDPQDVHKAYEENLKQLIQQNGEIDV